MIVHLATLLSVLIVYWKKITELFRGLFVRGEGSTVAYVGKLALATVPAVVFGLLLKDWFGARFEEPLLAGTMIMVTGSVVWSSRWARKDGSAPLWELVPLVLAFGVSVIAGSWLPFLAALAVEAVIMVIARLTAPREWQPEPGWGGALLMGFAQVIAILPGVSRSGSTVVTGFWRRIDPVAAAEFSFLMSIPAIVGAAILMIPDALDQGGMVPTGQLIAGFIAAAIAGVLAIRFFVALLRRQNFYVFAYYCWLVGAAFVLLHE
jgi:undecaprenyl-diphosphatase